MFAKSRPPLCLLVLSFASLTFANHAWAQEPTAPPAPDHTVKVSEAEALSLVSEKTPLKYPDGARRAGIQGAVVLKVIVAETGEVKEVSPISGDPALTEAAVDAVKQWKYKPYTLNGTPTTMETQVTINYRLKAAEHTTPPLGVFHDDSYTNEFLGIDYPLSRDWVRETEVMRKRFSAAGQSPGAYILLAAVHIPQQTAPLEADSSFVFSAIESAGRNCAQHLQAMATALRSQKVAQQKGSISSITIAQRDFYRADFDFREIPSHRTFLCTQSRDYLLQWNIGGLSKAAVDSTISTLNAIRTPQPGTGSIRNPRNDSFDRQLTTASKKVDRVRVSQGVTQGLVIKKVQPLYPEQARYAHIQGSVVMSVVINKNGDVIDLEVLDGPIELVVSAVNAVRQWKYRPYTFNGDPVEVETQITVNYVLS